MTKTALARAILAAPFPHLHPHLHLHLHLGGQ